MNTVPELLCPAGGMLQLKTALHYGADAVYGGMQQYGLRAFAGNFTEDSLQEAVNFLEGLLGASEEDRLRDYDMTYYFGLTNRTRFHNNLSTSSINPRFYAMYKSYPTNANIEALYMTYNSESDDESLLQAFRDEMIDED